MKRTYAGPWNNNGLLGTSKRYYQSDTVTRDAMIDEVIRDWIRFYEENSDIIDLRCTDLPKIAEGMNLGSGTMRACWHIQMEDDL